MDIPSRTCHQGSKTRPPTTPIPTSSKAPAAMRTAIDQEVMFFLGRRDDCDRLSADGIASATSVFEFKRIRDVASLRRRAGEFRKIRSKRLISSVDKSPRM